MFSTIIHFSNQSFVLIELNAWLCLNTNSFQFLLESNTKSLAAYQESPEPGFCPFLDFTLYYLPHQSFWSKNPWRLRRSCHHGVWCLFLVLGSKPSPKLSGLIQFILFPRDPARQLSGLVCPGTFTQSVTGGRDRGMGDYQQDMLFQQASPHHAAGGVQEWQ